MKKSLALILALIMALSLAACAPAEPAPVASPSAPSAAEPTPSTPAEPAPSEPAKPERIALNIAYMPNYASLWSVLTGIEMGYFDEEGIDITLYEFADGPTEIAAMEGGSIDLAYIGQGAHKLCINGQATIFAFSHISDGDAVIGLTSSGVNTLEDLKGKKVGYASGTSSETILNQALASVGLTMKDIEAYDMDASNMVTAMVSGSLDACAAWSPSSLQILSEIEGAKKLCSNVDFVDQGVSLASWIAMNDYPEKNPDTMLRFTRALFKAMDYASKEENYEQVAKWVAEQCAIDYETAYSQRGDAQWFSGKDVAKAASDGTLESYYQKQQDVFIAQEAVENPRALDEYIMFDLMVEAGNY